MDIYELLPTEENADIFVKELEEGEESLETEVKAHYVPFIAYVGGSYFGDTDILCKDRLVNDRDSTAKADEECDFLVINHEIIK